MTLSWMLWCSQLIFVFRLWFPLILKPGSFYAGADISRFFSAIKRICDSLMKWKGGLSREGERAIQFTGWNQMDTTFAYNVCYTACATTIGSKGGMGKKWAEELMKPFDSAKVLKWITPVGTASSALSVCVQRGLTWPILLCTCLKAPTEVVVVQQCRDCSQYFV